MDVLDRPDLGGGWEEIWRSLEMVEFFDLDVVIKYTLLLENAPTSSHSMAVAKPPPSFSPLGSGET